MKYKKCYTYYNIILITISKFGFHGKIYNLDINPNNPRNILCKYKLCLSTPTVTNRRL